jgi:hypothetical protein
MVEGELFRMIRCANLSFLVVCHTTETLRELTLTTARNHHRLLVVIHYNRDSTREDRD